MLKWTRDKNNVMTAHSNVCECVYVITHRGCSSGGYNITVTPESYRPFLEVGFAFREHIAKRGCGAAECRIVDVEPQMGKRGCDTETVSHTRYMRAIRLLKASYNKEQKLADELHDAHTELAKSHKAENNCRLLWHDALKRLDEIRNIMNREAPIS